MTESIEELFQSRKKLYDNREILCEVLNDKEDVCNEEYQEIKRNVMKGKEILMSELEKNKELTMKTIVVDEFESLAKSACSECQNNLLLIKTCFEKTSGDLEGLQNHIDGALYCISEILELINSTVAAEKQSIHADVIKNKAAIKMMAEAYNILKNVNMMHLCPVCLSSEVNVFCDPCGHSFCNKCIKNTHFCYICRLKISRTRPLFFP